MREEGFVLCLTSSLLILCFPFFLSILRSLFHDNSPLSNAIIQLVAASVFSLPFLDTKIKKMKRTKSDVLATLSRQRSTRIQTLFILFCSVLIVFEVLNMFKNGLYSVSQEILYSNANGLLDSKLVMEILEGREAPIDAPFQSRKRIEIKRLPKRLLSGLNFTAIPAPSRKNGILKSANDAVELGRKLWGELEESGRERGSGSGVDGNVTEKVEKCPYSVLISGDEFGKKGGVAVLPCGLTLGSHITVVGRPVAAQFVVELQGLKAVEGEEPPRILHFNPRLEGDWSGEPVIELNTCYRMQWGAPLRCEGWRSEADQQTGEWNEGVALF